MVSAYAFLEKNRGTKEFRSFYKVLRIDKLVDNKERLYLSGSASWRC